MSATGSPGRDATGELETTGRGDNADQSHTRAILCFVEIATTTTEAIDDCFRGQETKQERRGREREEGRLIRGSRSRGSVGGRKRTSGRGGAGRGKVKWAALWSAERASVERGRGSKTGMRRPGVKAANTAAKAAADRKAGSLHLAPVLLAGR